VTHSQWRATIYVNGRFLCHPVTGVQRYAHEMLTALDKLLTARTVEPVLVTILAPPNAQNLPSWTTLRTRKVGRLTGHLWEQLDLPVHARDGLLFTPCGGAPIVHKRNVITIHDAGPFSTPNAYTFAYRNYYKVLERTLARTALHLITDSQFSRQELIRFTKVPENRISTVPLSGEHILRHALSDTVLANYGLSSGQYILAVGSMNPNKNLEGLVKAYQQLPPSDICLAIAGGSNKSIFKNSIRIAGSIRQLGFVSDADLRTLYQYAGCFVFPSLYEGFGIPPLEALTLGTPVIVSRAASLPEIFGEAATYCDPHSPEDIARQICHVLQNKSPDREAAIQYASHFTWEKCARQTWSILLETLRA